MMHVESFFTFRTIKWEDGEVVTIDQRALPHELKLIRIRTVEQMADAIKNMAIRGAPAIGSAAAFGLALAAYRSKKTTIKDLMDDLMKAYRVLASTRPTAVNLFWALDRVISKAREAETVEEARELILEEALAIWREDYDVNRRIGDYGADLLEDGDRVLTHCKWL